MSKNEKHIHTDEEENSEEEKSTTISKDNEQWCDLCDDWKPYSESGLCVTCDTPISEDEARIWGSLEEDIWNRNTGSVWQRPDYTSYTNQSLGGHTSSLWSGNSYGSYGGWSWGGGTGTSTFSSYSSGEDDARKLLKHKRHLDSLCAVVEPTIKQKINWKTDEGNYMTNLETQEILLDGRMLLDDEDKLDVMAGISIHEKLHLVHTPAFNKLAKRVRGQIESRFGSRGAHLYQTVCNMVEDEYIEKQLRDTCPGFVDYIGDAKSHFFEKAEDSMKETEDRPGTDLLNTLLLFIRYPEAISKGQKDRWASDLPFFAGTLTKALENREATFGAVNRLFRHLMKRFSEMDKPEPPAPPTGGSGSGSGGMPPPPTGDSEEDSELDSFSEMRDFLDKMSNELFDSEEETQSLVKQLAGFSEEEMDGREKISSYAPEGVVDKETATTMKSLEDTDFTEEKIPKEYRVRTDDGDSAGEVTWRTVRDNSHHGNLRYDETVKNYKSFINALKRRFQLYGNDRKVTIRNQRNGKLDKRVLHRIPSGNKDLFRVDTIQQDKPLDVIILVDESGSMTGEKIRIAREACIILKEALENNPKIDLWIYGHDADSKRYGTTDLRVYKAPNIKDSPKACGSIDARHNNRDGYALYSIGQRVKQESDAGNKKLLIVISDGQPNAHRYGGQSGMKHVNKMVKKLEKQNYSVIQLGVYGIDEQDMAAMFKNWVFIRDTNDLPVQMTKILRRVLKV